MSPLPVLTEADWPAPASIRAFTTTRRGGVSRDAYASWNLAAHVGDEAAAVASNRATLLRLLPAGTRVQWLEQVHGNQVVEAPLGNAVSADACWTRQHGVACAVLTADCLPVLLCDRQGTRVAAVHAGWRGLLAGVLENTVTAMTCSPDDLLAWLGPAIGPTVYEVGPEVREAFLAAKGETRTSVAGCFTPSESRSGHYLADLYALARLRLGAAGVRHISGGNDCTYSNTKLYYSYRRDGQTGRMASVILINPA